MNFRIKLRKFSIILGTQLFITLFLFCEPSNCAQNCPNSQTLDDGFQLNWPETVPGSNISSTPFCLDANYRIIQRYCTLDGKWYDVNEKCHLISYEKFNGCPSGASNLKVSGNKTICVIIDWDKKKWSNEFCVKKGALKSLTQLSAEEISEIEKLLRKRNIKSIWLPIRRDEPYSPVQVKLPGPLWGEVVTKSTLPFNFSDDFQLNCVKISLSPNETKLSTANCDEKLNFLCIYDENYAQSCGSNKYSTYLNNLNSKCFTVEKLDTLESDLETLIAGNFERISLNFIQDLLGKFQVAEKSRCVIDRVGEKFVTVDRSGKFRVESRFDCVVLAEELSDDSQAPELHLKFEEAENKLFLIVYNPKINFKCFTNGNNELIKPVKIQRKLSSHYFTNSNIQFLFVNRTISVNRTIYELSVDENGIKYYWCEGHSTNSFQFIETSKVVAYSRLKPLVYAVEVTVGVDEAFAIDKESLDGITDNYLKLIGNSIVIKQLEVLKIANFDEKTRKVCLILHLTVDSDAFQVNSSSSEAFYYNVKQKTQETLKSLPQDTFKLITFKSTEFCLPTKPVQTSKSHKLNWDIAKIGQSTPPIQLCLQENGFPITRKCSGDLILGGTWEKLDPNTTCMNEEAISLHTRRLYRLSDSYDDEKKLEEILKNVTDITKHYNQLYPVDVYYVGKSMEKVYSSLKDDHSLNFAVVMNNMMNIGENDMKSSQFLLNSSNILVDNFENFIESLIETDFEMEGLKVEENLIVNHSSGSIFIGTENLIVLAFDAKVTNINGIALLNEKSESSKNLLDYQVAKLYSNESLDAFLEVHKSSIEVLTHFPTELLEKLASENENPLKIIIKIYQNDVIFQENRKLNPIKADSKVISVSLPGRSKFLPTFLPILMKKHGNAKLTARKKEEFCGYWDFQSSGSVEGYGKWSSEGCYYIGESKYDNLLACGCTHLTNYAYLITGTFYHNISVENEVIVANIDTHSIALDVISIVGNIFSLLGIIGIFVTAAMFRKWSKKTSTRVLIQLSLAIGLQMLIICFFNTESYYYEIEEEFVKCVFLGSSLHYFVLVTFSWTLITAFLQFKRYVVVLGNLKPENFLIKSFFVGWVLPLLPVVVILLINPNLYVPNLFGICYPQGWAFYLGVLLPVGGIIVVNLIIFCVVIYKISIRKNLRTNEQNMARSQLRVSIFLFFLLGLTWIFGLLTKANIVFYYLFCVTGATQGFVLFIYFVIMDPITRNLWAEKFRTWKSKKEAN